MSQLSIANCRLPIGGSEGVDAQNLSGYNRQSAIGNRQSTIGNLKSEI
jgi:hypothetical protein